MRNFLMFGIITSLFWPITGLNAGNFELLVDYKDSPALVLQSYEDDAALFQAQMLLNSDPSVEAYGLNYRYKAAIIPSDTYFDNQWYLKKIKAPDAWNIRRSAAEVVIAVIDSGVQITHPDLSANIWQNSREIAGNGLDDDKNGYIDDIYGWDFVSGTADPAPKFAPGFTESGIIHGTIVAGIAAAYGNNGIGASGVVWQAQIMALKALGDDGSGDTANVIRAIDYAVANGADIINLSFVGAGQSVFLEQAIRRAYDAGLIIVAAAGNDESQGRGIDIDAQPLYPACHDGRPGENMVIGVTATDALDAKADFASYGFRCIDMAAPGVSIYNTTVFAPGQSHSGKSFDKYYDGYWSGTSMATPMVSAAAALVLASNPTFERDDIHNTLLRQSDNITPLNPSYFGKLGVGRLNLSTAVAYASRIYGDKNVSVISAPQSRREPLLRISDIRGQANAELLAYNREFTGGVNVAAGDVDGDGLDEVITGAQPGGGPHIRIFKADGSLAGQFFAGPASFRGGVNVAAGDVDGDGIDEIVAGLGPGSRPEALIFDKGGRSKGRFLAFAENFTKGINVAAGDVDGDRRDEIIVGAQPGGGPQVRIFKADGRLQGQFFAYDSRFRGGVNVAAGRLPAGSRHQADTIITAPAAQGGPHIRLFDDRARLLGQFFAYDAKYRGGVSIAAGDLDRDGGDEIVTGAGQGGSPHVRIFEHGGSLIDSFYAFEAAYAGGVNVSVLNH